jgi:hypothetical protein
MSAEEPSLADLMFKLEDLDSEAATRITMNAIDKANWPYSQCGLGFGDPEDWTPSMKRHAPVMRRTIEKRLKELQLQL